MAPSLLGDALEAPQPVAGEAGRVLAAMVASRQLSPPLEGARWWPAGAPEPVGKADTNESEVTTINTKADTGNTEEAEHGSQQGLIDKHEREERHTTDSDSDTKTAASRALGTRTSHWHQPERTAWRCNQPLRQSS